jgi:hypothetical protein
MEDAAEAQVARELTRLQPRYGYSALHDVLVGTLNASHPISARLSHVVVDRYGVLVLDTRTFADARVRGGFADHRWTVSHPGGRRETFRNPLRQNRHAQSLLLQLLREAGFPLLPDQVRGLTVFVDTDISRIELDAATVPRVADLSQLAERFSARHDFVVEAPMTAEETRALAEAVHALDRSADPAFVRADGSPARGAEAGGSLKAQGRRRRATDEPPRHLAFGRRLLSGLFALVLGLFAGASVSR